MIMLANTMIMVTIIPKEMIPPVTVRYWLSCYYLSICVELKKSTTDSAFYKSILTLICLIFEICQVEIEINYISL